MRYGLVRVFAWGVCVTLLASVGVGSPQSLLLQGDSARAPLIDVSQGNGALLTAPRGGLFDPRPMGSFFAPIERAFGDARLVALRDLIASAEAGAADYNAVQYGARIRPGKLPTHMTLAEIDAWIEATPGQPHAIGRYQFIPPTLRRLVRDAGLTGDTVFSPRVQDQLADMLLAEAGIDLFLVGQLPQMSFMNNLAKIWAGLPNSSGKSHYHGYAGNKATMSWAHFRAEMDRIFPRG